MGLTTLGNVLLEVDRHPIDAVLFLPFVEVWEPRTRCAVEAVDHYADEPAIPALAADCGLKDALDIAQVQSIVSNARQQRPHASVSDLLQAFLFYYDRDAFIDFSDTA